MDILEWVDEYEPCVKLEEWKIFLKTEKDVKINIIHSPRGNNLWCDIWKERENV